MKEHARDRRTRILSTGLAIATLIAGAAVAALGAAGHVAGAGGALGVLTVCALSSHGLVLRQMSRASLERRARLVQHAPPAPSTSGWQRVGVR